MSYTAIYNVNGHDIHIDDGIPPAGIISGALLDYINLEISMHLSKALLASISDVELLDITHWFIENADEIDRELTEEVKRKTYIAPLARKAKTIAGWDYVLQADKYYKIGKASNVSKRFKGISTKLPFKSSLVCKIKTDDMTQLETSLHEKYAEYRTNGEWFILPPEEVEELKRCAYHSQEGAYV